MKGLFRAAFSAPMRNVSITPMDRVTAAGQARCSSSRRDPIIVATSFEYLNAWIIARLNIESDRGASLVEYALLVALIAVVCIIAITFLGKSASSKFSSVGSAIS